jgi:hypothetical protein
METLQKELSVSKEDASSSLLTLKYLGNPPNSVHLRLSSVYSSLRPPRLRVEIDVKALNALSVVHCLLSLYPYLPLSYLLRHMSAFNGKLGCRLIWLTARE